MELTIDTAGDRIGLALSREGVAFAERLLPAERAHTATLAPGIDELLRAEGQTPAAIRAIFVCAGPGGYTGLRSGVTAAKGLAIALGVPIVGIDRFRAEAWPHRDADRPVVVVHHIVRREYAWQELHRGDPAGPPATGSMPALIAATPPDALVTGEIDDVLAEALAGRLLVRGDASRRQPSAIAAIGWQRLIAGTGDDPAALAPVYLREPAIGPQQTTGEDKT